MVVAFGRKVWHNRAVKVGVDLRVCVANEQGAWCGKCRRDERGRMVDEDEEV